MKIATVVKSATQQQNQKIINRKPQKSTIDECLQESMHQKYDNPCYSL